MDKPIKVVSDDGSHTLRSPRFNVTYHSIYGAIDESITVFISAGLYYQILRKKKRISVFEMGFGTGLNAFLTFLESKRHPGIEIAYTGIEKFPIDVGETRELNYPQILSKEKYQDDFIKMHTFPFNSLKYFSDNFSFLKISGDLLDLQLESLHDVIYFDAFAPTAQEELWTVEVMNKMYKATNPGGILVSYCAKGSFKRALREAGYIVEPLPGPPGKREMTRAIKPI